MRIRLIILVLMIIILIAIILNSEIYQMWILKRAFKNKEVEKIGKILKRSKHPKVRLKAVHYIAKLEVRDERKVFDIFKLAVDDRYLPVRINIARNLSKYSLSKENIMILIKLLKDVHPAVIAEANSSLEKVTGLKVDTSKNYISEEDRKKLILFWSNWYKNKYKNKNIY